MGTTMAGTGLDALGEILVFVLALTSWLLRFLAGDGLAEGDFSLEK